MTHYFRDVSEHEVLGADGEQALAREIEAREIRLWQQALSFPPLTLHVLDVAAGASEEPMPDTEALREALARGETLAEPAQVVAAELRAADRERDRLSVVLGELQRLADARHPLTAEEGFDLFHASIRAADRSAARVRNAFVEANLRLVMTIAYQYTSSGVPLADLIQEGNLGLLKAVDRFDYSRGYRFSTYAGWWIRHMIGRAVANKSRTVRLPVHILDKKQRLNRVTRELSAQLGRTPSQEEIAEAAGLTVDKIEEIRRLGGGIELSLDQPMGEDGDESRHDIFQDPGTDEETPLDVIVQRARAEGLGAMMSTLSPREADVVRKRFAFEDDRSWTLREIAESYGVSRERVRQIQNRALRKMRAQAEAQNLV